MSAKLATLGLLGINFLAMMSSCLPRGSNHVMDVVMRLKFGNASISLRKVIITSILSGFDQKNLLF